MFDKSKFKKETVGNQVTFTYEEKDTFVKNAGVDHKVLKQVEDYKQNYLKELTTVSSELAKDVMVKDKKIESVVVEAPWSTSERGGVEIVVDRSKTFTGGPKGNGNVTKSKISINVSDPYSKVSKKYIKDLEADLTKLLIKE